VPGSPGFAKYITPSELAPVLTAGHGSPAPDRPRTRDFRPPAGPPAAGCLDSADLGT